MGRFSNIPDLTPSGFDAWVREVDAEAGKRLVVDVRDHGAVGDGVTDDSAAIQAAVDAVKAAGGGTVTFPAGNYLGTILIEAPSGGGHLHGVCLSGVGKGSRIVSPGGSTPTLHIKGASNVDRVIGTTVSALQFDGNNVGAVGVKIEYANEIAIDGRTLITNHTGDGLELGVNNWVGYFNAFIRGNGGRGVAFVGQAINNLTFDACRIQGNGSHGVEFAASGNVLGALFDGCDIEGNTGNGVKTTSGTLTGVVFSGGYMEHNTFGATAGPQMNLVGTPTLAGWVIQGVHFDGADHNTNSIYSERGVGCVAVGNYHMRNTGTNVLFAGTSARSWTVQDSGSVMRHVGRGANARQAAVQLENMLGKTIALMSGIPSRTEDGFCVYDESTGQRMFDVKTADREVGIYGRLKHINGGPEIIAGSGSPEGVVTAEVGSIYQQSNGGAGTTFWVKESGTGNTGWVAK